MMHDEMYFEHILDEAIAMFQTGKSIDEIVALYPENAEDLRGMLDVARMTDDVLHEVPEAALSRTLSQVDLDKGVVKGVRSWVHTFFTQRQNYLVYAVGLVLMLSIHLDNRSGHDAVQYASQSVGVSSPSGQYKTYANQGHAIEVNDLALRSATYTGLSNVDSGNAVTNFVRRMGCAVGVSGCVSNDSVYSLDGGFGSPNAIDNREFLQTHYSLTIKTRDVPSLAEKAKTIIRGYKGRIDSARVSDFQSRIAFVVPKERFQELRSELRALGLRWYVYEMSSEENMLYEKQSIEARSEETIQSLASLEKQREDLVKKHEEKVALLNQKFTRFTRELSLLKSQRSTASSSQERATIETTIYLKEAEISNVTQQIYNENTKFARENAFLQDTIAYKKSALTSLEKNNEDVLLKAETVQGVLVIDRLGFREAFLRITPYNYAFVVVVLVSYWYWQRKRKHQ